MFCRCRAKQWGLCPNHKISGQFPGKPVWFQNQLVPPLYLVFVKDCRYLWVIILLINHANSIAVAASIATMKKRVKGQLPFG